MRDSQTRTTLRWSQRYLCQTRCLTQTMLKTTKTSRMSCLKQSCSLLTTKMKYQSTWMKRRMTWSKTSCWTQSCFQWMKMTQTTFLWTTRMQKMFLWMTMTQKTFLLTKMTQMTILKTMLIPKKLQNSQRNQKQKT